MADLPRQFQSEYEARGETFFAIARLLLEHHGRQYTLDEIADEVSVSKSRVSTLTRDLVADGWLDSREGQMTLVWNTETYNPAEMAAGDAVLTFYRDLWTVFGDHLRTTTGPYAVFGFALFVASGVSWFLALWSAIIGATEVPLSFYVALGLGLGVTGALVTALASTQALVNRGLDRVLDR
ncbi:MAG: helix-turn-helix domain-containing protein [Haloarculaceae archaeon]